MGSNPVKKSHTKKISASSQRTAINSIAFVGLNINIQKKRLTFIINPDPLHNYFILS